VLPAAPHSSSPAELKARLAAERRGHPFVLYRDEEGGQRIVELTGAVPRLCVGRDPTSEIPLWWDREVSRVHARIEHIGGEWTVVDDGRSRNGSFVNGDRLQGRQRLRDGDVLRLGATALRFFAPPAGDSQQTAPSARPEAPHLSAAQRRVIAEKTDSYSAQYPKVRCMVAVVLSSPVQRGIVKAIMWLTRQPLPTEVFASVEDGVAWAAKALAAQAAAAATSRAAG